VSRFNHPDRFQLLIAVFLSSSTLENWLREFKQFAPDISVVAYYASKEERPRLRQDLLESQASTSKKGVGWEVLVTTYNLAQGDDRDRKFFRRIEWDVRIADLALTDY
jgi:SWI/SNF-related matrix-associated actin-dependent regulator of chromatin subfamily A containing DEAD/H box 1